MRAARMQACAAQAREAFAVCGRAGAGALRGSILFCKKLLNWSSKNMMKMVSSCRWDCEPLSSVFVRAQEAPASCVCAGASGGWVRSW